MNSNSSSPEKNVAQLTTVSMGSIDSLTISYLKGEISFQEYESIIENQQFQNKMILNQLNASQIDKILFPNSSDQDGTENEFMSVTNAVVELATSSTDDEAGRKISSPGKKSRTRDRFLNMKDIMNDDEEMTSEDDEESETKSNEESDEQDEDDDEFDETSKWNDFDIETLNFDKFIKDHQVSSSSKKSTGHDSFNQAGEESSSGNKRKKDKDQRGLDSVELKAKRRRNRVLPIEIQGLMGEANLAYARGDSNKAIDTCLEVIKYAPRASEPYQLLSLLYSEIGQNEKALRVGLIAAQLNKDPDEWVELIQQAVIVGDHELILFCYNNAIQCDPKNIKLHLDRISLLEERTDVRRLMLAKLMLLKYVDVAVHADIYQKFFAQVIAELKDNEVNDRNKKIYVLKNDLKKFQNNFAVENLKLLIKLLMEQKSYKEAIMTMISQGNIRAKLAPDNELLSTVEFDKLNDYDFVIPETCNSYIQAQFITCLINLNYSKESIILNEFYEKMLLSLEKYGEELLLIADTYYARKNYPEAKRFYFILLSNLKEYIEHMSIWLRYGHCCNQLNQIDEAINAYRNAVNLDTSNCEAALCLVNILKKNSTLFDEASTVIQNTLSQKRVKTLTPQILNLMVNQGLILYEQHNYEKFISCAKHVLFADYDFILENEIIQNLLKADSRVQRALIFHQALEKYNYEFVFSYNKLHVHMQDTIFEIYLKLCKALVILKRHNDLLVYSVGATVLPMIYERKDWNKAINFSCLVACILKSDGRNAFNILKDFILEYKNSNKLWSYVGIVIGLCPSLSQQKFFIRLGAKYMDHLPLCMINAHFAIMSGTYRYALVEYMNCFKQNPFDPFINLIIAITYCHISCQKFNTRRHLLVSQSLVFLRRYIKFRGVCQETYYNIARVMHQLSLFDLAVHFYQKCLQLPCTFPHQKEVYDLTRFAAYNLVTIYRHNGAEAMARIVMKKYLTI